MRSRMHNPLDHGRVGSLGRDAGSPGARERPRASLALRASAVGAAALGAVAIGALAIGALAIGRLAIGRLATGQLAIGRARIRRLEIDELVVRKDVPEALQGSRVPGPEY